ncbi:hypothetical protein JTB14_010619 [Gonioctena quinquepunctata]|nr:hypothetical protein JTB14_010619 [Gonioctena quinquepunctata]
MATIQASLDFTWKTKRNITTVKIYKPSGNCLCNVASKSTVKRSRPSISLEEAKRHRGIAQHIPPRDVRTDQVGHCPVHAEKRTRCKFPGCKGYTDIICEKCGVVLCLNKKNGFRRFHH